MTATTCMSKLMSIHIMLTNHIYHDYATNSINIVIAIVYQNCSYYELCCHCYIKIYGEKQGAGW